MINQLIQSYMTQLQSKNSKGFQQIQNMMNMKQNPEPFVKQIFGNMQPQQKQQMFKQLQGFGCPKEVLSKLQNMK